MNIYLVQRGSFKDYTNLPINYTFDTLVKLDYMGAAEFEFGAVQDSLQKFVYSDNIIINLVTINGKDFNVIYPCKFKDSIYLNEIISTFTEMVKDKHYTKCSNYFKYYFDGKEIERLKKGCKNKKETVDNFFYRDFWWDIANHYMIIPSSIDPRYLLQAFKNLNSKGWNKPFEKLSFIEKIKGIFNGDN
jgi:hypothetical protein